MNQRILIALLALAAFANRVHAVQPAAQHANVDKGFKPGQAYAVSDVDQINLFNGNLNVSIPIGGTYRVASSLSYELMLTYSGNNWEYEQKHCVIGKEPDGALVWGDAQWADPYRRQNAGMGWLLSLGRIYTHVDARLPVPHYTYQSPDGADHTLYPGLHSNYSELTAQDTNFSRDGTYIRHKVLRDANNTLTGHQLEFTDGTIRVFDDKGLISGIRDRFGNRVTIQRYPAGSAGIPAPDATACGASYAAWRIDDGHRVHYIYHQLTPGYAFMKERVCQAKLAAFGGNHADYLFRYTDRHISRQKTGPDPYNESEKLPPTLQVPLLTKIELPDGTSYEMVYDIGMRQVGTDPAVGLRSDGAATPTHVSDLLTQINPGGYSGHLIELKLPTRGRYEWLYRRYTFPPDYERHPRLPGEIMPPTWSAGVAARKIHGNGGEPDTWTYESSYLSEHVRTVAITTVTAPDGSKTDNYFSLWSSGTDRDYDYGLPFTRKVMTGELPKEYPNPRDGMYLSTVTFLPENKKRLTYVLYEREPVVYPDTQRDDNRRVTARMTVFEDDPEKVTKEVYSDFDGLGHFRTTTISATGGTIERVTTTRFNPGSPPDAVLDGTEWITEDYDFVETIDRDPVSKAMLAREKTEYCFDSVNGRLLRTRVLRGTNGTSGRNDLLTVLKDADAAGGSVDGNVSQEEYYGGDEDLLPSDFSTCGGDPADLTLGYRIHHEYESGALARSRYEGTSFNVLDLTIDPSSGLPSATRDSAGVTTTLHYDLLGRLTGARPAGRAWSEYVYSAASGTTGPGLTARQCSSDETDCAASALSEARYYYDLLGRLIQQRQRIVSTADASQWAATWTEYDKGRQSAVSVVVGQSSGAASPMPSGTKQTKWLYDELGRITSIEQPDGSFTLYGYPDSRRTERSTMVALTNTSSEWVTTTETTDFLGRLASVTEAAGQENVTTTYRYDAGDRLVTVNPGSVAERRFVYDGAGLLMSERQPESGTTSYRYDARGHALETRTADCHFDLNYTWDSAERLVRIDARDDASFTDKCAAPGWRPMKEFVFEDDPSTGDRGLGRLRSAIRYNASSFGLIRVTETLTYGETGRVTDKRTAVDEMKIDGAETLQTFEQRVVYDQLDRIVDTVYPVCIEWSCGEAPYDGVRTAFDDRGVKSVDAGWYSGGGFTLRAGLATVRHAPNGLRVQTAHSNGVTEQIVPDPSGVVRPQQITWSGFSATCSAPAIDTGPASDPAVPYGQTRTLTVTANGTGPFTYEWFSWLDQAHAIPNATSASFTTPPVTEVQRYWVVVSSACGKVRSATAVLTPFEEEPPDPPSSLSATRQGSTWTVRLEWAGSAGAATYQIERRSGGVFSVVGTTSAESWVDGSCAPGSACVYRVRAVASGGTQSVPGNHDLATLMSFSPAGVNSVVSYEDFEGILDAVNAIRAAAGLAPLTWAQVVPGGAPPMEEGVVEKAHVLNLRVRMDEALAANGIPSPAYADAVLSLFRYHHIEQLRERTQ